MSKIFQKDLITIILLALLSIASLIVPSLNKFSATPVLYVLVLFFLPGYSILTALSPKIKLIKKIILGIPVSVAILLLLISFPNYIKIPFETILLILSVFTLFFALIGHMRKFKSPKKPKSEYIICESCKGYYKLEKWESLDDFSACHCGGKLRHAENNFMSKQRALKRRKFLNTKIPSKKSKTSDNNYLTCENCGGRYKLEKGESLDDFEKCNCGGELKYAKKYFRPKTTSVKRDSGSKFQKINLIVIILALASVAAINIPSISNSNLRLILILPLLFFLPGYSLTKILFRHLSLIKLIISSIVLSAVITFLLSLAFSNFVKVPQTTCTLILASFTIILTIIPYLQRPKLGTTGKKYSKLPESHSKSFKIKNAEFKSSGNEHALIDRTSKFIPYKDSIFTFPDKNSKFMPSDILIVWLITALCVIFVLVPVLNDTFLRIILGILLILFIPGYALIAALFPKKDDLDGIERSALSFGLSIATTPLIGLILNYTPFGIRLEPILISVSAFTILMSVVAYIRRFKLPEGERLNFEFKKHYESIINSFKAESGISKVLSIILIVSIILAISGTIYVVSTPKQGEKFTDFYILGPTGKASDYPTNLTTGQTGNVTIGVVNHEYSNVNYKLMVKLNNITIDEKNITLSNNEKYEASFTFSPSHPGDKQKLEFLLYKLPDENNTYRSLHLWLNVG